MNVRTLLCSIFLSFTSALYAMPSEVIIIRHADKIVAPHAGPTLSAAGMQRSLVFANYYVTHFLPVSNDIALITFNPKGGDDIDAVKTKPSSSIRGLQTLAPLANQLQTLFPQKKYEIFDPYTVTQVKELAHYVLTLKNQVVLICWEHNNIPSLIHALGSKAEPKKWPSDDFDSVYIIHYDKNGKIENETFLHHQYDLTNPPTNWDALEKSFSYKTEETASVMS